MTGTGADRRKDLLSSTATLVRRQVDLVAGTGGGSSVARDAADDLDDFAGTLSGVDEGTLVGFVESVRARVAAGFATAAGGAGDPRASWLARGAGTNADAEFGLLLGHLAGTWHDER